MRRWLIGAFAAVASAMALGWIGGDWLLESQGIAPEDWERFEGARVRFDASGVPTIEGKTWLEVIEAEGYVVASERLFQMDLMRRSAAGRLSEWFGQRALELDRKRKLEAWEEVAARAYRDLPESERSYVDAYGRGVNRFIGENRRRWGIEYAILRTEPETWEGKDSLLIMLSMAEQLTAFSWMEALAGRWSEHIGEEWARFLFTEDHPWNEPMFGTKHPSGPPLPVERALPLKPIDPEERGKSARAIASLRENGAPQVIDVEARDALPAIAQAGDAPHGMLHGASNNWAYCGEAGCFVANDPHLGASVPHLWFALRLRVSEEDWVAGVSIPGLPGVVLGMNPHLAWAFTNVGEDVDDLLLERLNDDRTQYLAAIEGGREVWKPILREEKIIKVRGANDEIVTALFTHRGPLAKRPYLGEDYYSRQWLPLKPGFLRFPVDLSRARSWEEMNAALDGMKVPAQNVLVVDRVGNMGYRASGTGIVRRVGGQTPQPAISGEWVGFEPPDARPRILFYLKNGETRAEGPSVDREGMSPAGSRDARFLATANERIWVDDVGHRWSEDLRKDRIRRVLAARSDLGGDDMRRLQLDTESRYHRSLLSWVSAHLEPSSRASAGAAPMLDRWNRWTGSAAEDPESFTDALLVDRALTVLCLDRARRAFLPEDARGLPYEHWLRSAWVIAMLEADGGTRIFGLDAHDLARHLFEIAIERRSARAPVYYEINRWAAQHPFVGRIPVLGKLFEVDTPVQYGWRSLVRVEQPTFGASVRLVWNVSDPMKSTWSLPVGQSGHVRSPHFRDLQAAWFEGRHFPVFDDAWTWRSAPGAR